MSRQNKNIEFLKTMQSMLDLNDRQFAKACGKKPPNMHNYLAGNFIPKKRFLQSSAENLFGWSLKIIMEVERIPTNLNTISTSPGLYILFDSAANVLYIGKATNLRSEIRQTLGRKIPVSIRINKKQQLKKIRPQIKDLAHYVSAYNIRSSRLRHNLESLLLRVLPNQTHNSNIGKFK